MDPGPGSCKQLTSGQGTWSARCVETCTAGAAGGPGKPTGSNPGRAPRSDPTLLDWEDYPGPELAALYKRRWDGSETALREAKAPLRGAGPGTGPMLRSGSPDLVRQELAAWAAGTGMARGVVLDAALAAAPARKGRRAGLAVRPRDLSFTRALRAVLSAVRLGRDRYQDVTSEIAESRTVVDRDRHRARKSKSPSSFAHAGPADTVTRIAPAVITMANTPA